MFELVWGSFDQSLLLWYKDSQRQGCGRFGLFPGSYGLLVYYLRPSLAVLFKFNFVFVYFDDVDVVQSLPFVYDPGTDYSRWIVFIIKDAGYQSRRRWNDFGG